MPSWRLAFSPQYYWAHVSDAAVQHCLREIFERRGLPGGMRVDNGTPWGSRGDLPTPLAMWLIGLGIEVVFNPPRQPQKNGVIERSQGTAKCWAEPRRCGSLLELQQRLHEDDRLQRERYPYLKGRSRSEVFPGLAHSGRLYQMVKESRQWDLERVKEHLAGYVVPRKVNSKGEVSLYDRSYYVGVLQQGQTVYVMFDPQQSEWLFADADGKQVRSQRAVEIDAERIRSLKRRNKK